MERGRDLRKPSALSQAVFFDTLLRRPSVGGTGNSGTEVFPLIPSGDKVPLSCHGAGCKTRSETHRKQTSQSPVPSKGGGRGFAGTYFAFGPAAAMWAGMFGYFLAKFSANMLASLFACAS